MSDGYCMCGASPLVATDWHARGCPEWRPPATETPEPADPPGRVWRGKDQTGHVAVVTIPEGMSIAIYLPGGWIVAPYPGVVADIFAAAVLSERSRADAAEATLAAMREGIERVMREMKGGGT